jgi:hypothetical protein
VDQIIDAHGHLGDILEPGGGALIEKIGVVKERVHDPVVIPSSSRSAACTPGRSSSGRSPTGFWATG